MRNRTALCALLLLTAGCAQPTNNEMQTGWLDQAVKAFTTNPFAKPLIVVDENGKPIAGAQILIGRDINQPFADNFISTDSVGSFEAPSGWTTPETVTINAPGYVRATYLKQTPAGQTYTLRALEGGNLFQLNGKTTGHAVVDQDGFVDFGLVIPAISKAGFANLDIGDFISTDTDTISVAGKSIALPSNITLPRQQESYFITITLDKPQYRLNFKSEGTKSIFAAKGRFSLDDMVNAYQSGKQLFELANSFSMLGGILKDVAVKGAKTSSDLDTTKLAFKNKVSVNGPAVKSDEMTMVTPLSEVKGMFYPTDVKYLEAGKSQSLTTEGTSGAVLTLLKKKSEAQPKNLVDRMSSTFQPLKAGMTPTLLPLMANPTVKSAFEVSIPTIANIKGMFNGASYAVLSHVKKVPVGGNTVDVLSNIWEVYSPEWETNVAIPNWPGEKAPTGSLRWQVTLTSSPTQIMGVDLGPKWLEAATHATRSSADF